MKFGEYIMMISTNKDYPFLDYIFVKYFIKNNECVNLLDCTDNTIFQQDNTLNYSCEQLNKNYNEAQDCKVTFFCCNTQQDWISNLPRMYDLFIHKLIFISC